MTVRARLRWVALSGLVGWVIATVVTMPFQILELVQNAGGDMRLLAGTLGIGLTIWVVWTLAISTATILGVGAPIAIWTPPQVLLQHKRGVVASSLAAAALTTSIKFHIWKVFEPDPFYDAPLFVIYGVFSTVFAGVTAWLYLRMLQNRSASAE